MNSKLDYGLLHCDDRGIFYAELMYDNNQWGEIVLCSDSQKTTVTMWDCNFTVSTNDLMEMLNKASTHLIEFEASKKD
ncbi:hypothetical protein A7985_06880 [Pseudoalteromonas luteoviolacea]|uniref:Uncharacterized protein n=1 Tax=Pseudoalteromonas luteoviolacea TaxID=43657 RepID=A0A1C0TWG8_9GAMM|nr:hypothetical protein [Pseudoalteromonas luteoviolacea]OCQ23660.1 hypothetical protein A7985_06880 [Pseudoalteromonas luteoviolacea]